MSREFVSYGVIVGATPRPETEFTSLQELNEDVIGSLPEDPDWPWLDSSPCRVRRREERSEGRSFTLGCR